MGVVLFVLSVLNLSAFSLDESISLGMTESELLEITNAVKVDIDAGRGHGYTEFSEENPVVYIDNAQHEKKEYYFHGGQLYKVMTIFRDRVNDASYYQEKLSELEQRFGEPSRKFSDHVFSLVVLHAVWENEHEELDLRFGAGYVHAVITNKALRKDKVQKDLYKKAI